jgi:ATP-binding protein involved in chromosome partitioning
MVMKAIQQLLHEVDWGGLDVLVFDLPPGTGDIQLTITQQIKLDGAVIVSTPQNLSVKDSIRGINMFRKVDVPILGMVQNMSTFHCSNCGHEEHIFGKDGVIKACEELGVKLLGEIPLHPKIAQDTEEGKPTIVADPEGSSSRAFKAVAEQVAISIGI